MNFKFDELSEEELLKNAEEFERAELEMTEFEEKNPPIEVPKELDEKMLTIIREFECIELTKKNKARNSRYMRIAAMVFVCIFIGMTAITMNADAFKIKFFDFITEDNSNYIDIKIVEKGTLPPAIIEKLPKEWESVFYPAELPEGYVLETAEEFIGKSLDFINEETNRTISFDYNVVGDDKLSINSESSKTGETQVNGNSAIYSTNSENTILVWTDSGYRFELLAEGIRLNECIKIAESVIFVRLQ